MLQRPVGVLVEAPAVRPTYIFPLTACDFPACCASASSLRIARAAGSFLALPFPFIL